MSLRRLFRRARGVLRRTFNSDTQPHRDAGDPTRNDPGGFIGHWRESPHPILAEIAALAEDAHVPEARWHTTFAAMRTEVEALPGGTQVFAAHRELDRYLEDLGRAHGARYHPGSVNVDDGLFLYWLTRRLRPRTIVQTGVSNGLSCALLALALARNGDGGQLHAIDLPQVVDPKDPAWTQAGQVYGVAIPEGRSSGWLVPDSCRDRVHLSIGDAADLLPPLVERLGAVDMFFHDSDHSYQHMAFEFRTVRPVLTAGGLVVADDIAWNASLWDTADEWGVPAYNHAGSMGVAFL